MSGRIIAYPKPLDADFGLGTFKDAARRGVLLVPHCTACGKAHWYPRPHCPFCFCETLDWKPASGRATIYSYSIMRHAPTPYAIAFVTLEEGPAMMTNIVESGFDEIAIGKPVTLTWGRTEQGEPLPMFKLRDRAERG